MNPMNARLKTAVQSVSAPPYLAARIRGELDAVQHRSVWGARLMAVAAAAAVCIGVTVTYQLGHLRLTANSQESYVASVSNQVPSIMRVGLGDHIHCAVFRKYPAAPPTVEELAEDLGPKYVGLMQIVTAHAPSGFHLMMAHHCKIHGRRFVHLALTKGGQVLSMVIAVKGEGESFKTENLVPALSEAGIPIYRSGVQRFQIAAFESRDRLVYVISDLPQQKNMETVLALAPGVKEFLSRLES